MTDPAAQARQLTELSDEALAKALMAYMPHSSVWPHSHVVTAFRNYLTAASAAQEAELEQLRKDLARANQLHDATCHTRPRLTAQEAEIVRLKAERILLVQACDDVRLSDFSVRSMVRDVLATQPITEADIAWAKQILGASHDESR